jgi:hypothetical protein
MPACVSHGAIGRRISWKSSLYANTAAAPIDRSDERRGKPMITEPNVRV